MKPNQSQKNITAEWKPLKLGDIGKAIIGLTYQPEDVVSNGGTLVFRSSNVKDGRIDYSDQVRVLSNIPESLKIKEGDILICARNGSQNLIGKNALITKADEGNTFGAFMSVFRSKNSKYLYHLFQSQLFKKEIKKDLGPTINQVTTGNLHSFKFHFPPLPEQNRIVFVLETWDKAIEKLTQKIEIKKQIKKGLMQDLLTGKKRLSGFKGEWKIVKLKELTKKIGSGITPHGGSDVYTKKGVIFLRSQNIQNGYLNLADVEYISDEIDARMNNSRVSKNDILYNITGASIGRSSLYSLSDRANVNQHVCIIRLKNDNPKFVNYFLLSWSGTKQLDGFQAGGNRQGLNYNQLGSFKLLLPPLPEQTAIANILTIADEEITELEKKLSILKDQKKYLLNNLITGNIRTPENLLEKMR